MALGLTLLATTCTFRPGGGLAANAANFREILALRSAEHGNAGGNDQAAADSFARALDFLRQAGFIDVGS
jgi:hypothetical protein